MKELSKNNDKRMTVKEMSEATGISRQTISAYISKLFPEIVRNGKTTYLNEAQVTRIKMEYEKSGRNDLLNVKKVRDIKTDLEMALKTQEVMSYWIEKSKSLETRLKEAQPKIEFYEQVTDSTDAISIGEVAKVLNMNIGRNRLFELLREQGVLMRNNIPYQKYIDAGYFRVIEQKYSKPNGDVSINLKTVVYQSGVDYIRKILNNEGE